LSQVFGSKDAEPTNFSQFTGQSSLGSAQYYGKPKESGAGDFWGDDYSSEEDDLDGLVSNLAEETRRDLEVAAQMAGNFINNIMQ